jgi:uncharacterized OB-fold protein
MGKQVSVNDFVLNISDGEPHLIGGRCKECGNHTFPVMPGCPKCSGMEIEAVPLGTTGTLWAWTVQGFPPKSPPYLGENDPDKFKPFGVGYVELSDLIVESRLTESEPARLNEGMAMEMVLEPLFTDDDGNEVVTYAFKPVE